VTKHEISEMHDFGGGGVIFSQKKKHSPQAMCISEMPEFFCKNIYKARAMKRRLELWD
jgi:hypothetical protein